MPVALVGRVPVNVTNEGGAIATGDYITTSSTAGKGMKATKAGRVIGMALADFSGTSGQAFPEPRRRVMVQVFNTWYEPGVLTVLANGKVYPELVEGASARSTPALPWTSTATAASPTASRWPQAAST